MRDILHILWKKKLTASIIILFIPLCLAALLPIWLLIISSFADKEALASNGFQIWPENFSLDAYRYILVQPAFVVRAYGVTIFVTAVGTVLSIFITSMFAYVVSRPGFKMASKLNFFIFFTMLFNGGTLPTYLLISRYLHLKNTIWVLILPMMIAPFHVLLLRSQFKGLPASLTESAKLDGAGEFRIFSLLLCPCQSQAWQQWLCSHCWDIGMIWCLHFCMWINRSYIHCSICYINLPIMPILFHREARSIQG